MYIYVHTNTHTHMYICVHTNTHTHLYVCIYICIHAHTYTHTHINILYICIRYTSVGTMHPWMVMLVEPLHGVTFAW
jgi:hypothetical protein